MPEAVVTPAAAVAAPAATPTVPVVVATPESLLPPASEAVATPVATSVVTPEVNQNTPEWVLQEGVKGTGPPPAWFKADKYSTVDAQAKAYPELEKRFGSFTGAPADGKYEFNPPEGLGVTLEAEHPLLTGFQSWAKDNQLSQKGYAEVMGMFAEYEAGMAPSVASIKAGVGENADARIAAVSGWAKANLAPDQYELVRQATSGVNAAATFKAMEALIAKSRQVTLPKPGADVPGAQAGGEAAINEMQAKLGPDGKRLFETDAKYRAKVEAARVAYYSAAQAA